jgi:hypothetical protein
MAAGKRRRQVGALMIWSVVALGVSVINSSANAEDDASRFTYVRLHCTPDNQSHFTDVTIELTKENFAPPAAPIAIGGNKPTSRAFIAGSPLYTVLVVDDHKFTGSLHTPKMHAFLAPCCR